MTRQLADLRSSAVRLLRAYGRSEGEERTLHLRKLAEVVVDARATFTRDDGSPDLRGRSFAYRQWMTDILSDSGLDKHDQSVVRPALRHHVAVALRNRYNADTLEDYGLSPKSPNERMAGRRQKRTATINALDSGDIQGGAVLAVTAARTVLEKVDPDALADLDSEACQTVEEHLRVIQRKSRTLLNRLTRLAEPV